MWGSIFLSRHLFYLHVQLCVDCVLCLVSCFQLEFWVDFFYVTYVPATDRSWKIQLIFLPLLEIGPLYLSVALGSNGRLAIWSLFALFETGFFQFNEYFSYIIKSEVTYFSEVSILCGSEVLCFSEVSYFPLFFNTFRFVI